MYHDGETFRAAMNPELVARQKARIAAEERERKRQAMIERERLARMKVIKAVRGSEVIKAEAGIPTADMPVKQIIAMVAANHGLTYADMIQRNRSRRYSNARHDAMKVVHALKPHLSSPAIGAYFKRCHTSVLYAIGALKKSKGAYQWPEKGE